MLRYRTALLLMLFFFSMPARACIEEIGKSRQLAPELLRAVIAVESGGNPRAINHNTGFASGTRDIGAMQINSIHLPALAKSGIGESDLMDFCTNVGVGADILSGLVARKGLSWDTVGAYNAGCGRLKGQACTRARSRYAWKVYRQLARSGAVTALPAPVSAPVAWLPVYHVSLQ